MWTNRTGEAITGADGIGFDYGAVMPLVPQRPSLRYVASVECRRWRVDDHLDAPSLVHMTPDKLRQTYSLFSFLID